MNGKKDVHALCARCRERCKQPATAAMLTCDRFEPKMGDEEFDRLLSDMERLIDDVHVLNGRTSRLLSKMQEEKTDTAATDGKAE